MIFLQQSCIVFSVNPAFISCNKHAAEHRDAIEFEFIKVLQNISPVGFNTQTPYGSNKIISR